MADVLLSNAACNWMNRLHVLYSTEYSLDTQLLLWESHLLNTFKLFLHLKLCFLHSLSSFNRLQQLNSWCIKYDWQQNTVWLFSCANPWLAVWEPPPSPWQPAVDTTNWLPLHHTSMAIHRSNQGGLKTLLLFFHSLNNLSLCLLLWFEHRDVFRLSPLLLSGQLLQLCEFYSLKSIKVHISDTHLCNWVVMLWPQTWDSDLHLLSRAVVEGVEHSVLAYLRKPEQLLPFHSTCHLHPTTQQSNKALLRLTNDSHALRGTGLFASVWLFLQPLSISEQHPSLPYFPTSSVAHPCRSVWPSSPQAQF